MPLRNLANLSLNQRSTLLFVFSYPVLFPLQLDDAASVWGPGHDGRPALDPLEPAHVHGPRVLDLARQTERLPRPHEGRQVRRQQMQI